MHKASLRKENYFTYHHESDFGRQLLKAREALKLATRHCFFLKTRTRCSLLVELGEEQDGETSVL
jgi:hypothetical protein